jgi:hypothetical protein
MNWNPYLLQNIYLGDYNYVNWFAFAWVLSSIALALLIIALYIKSGFGYTVQDTEAHSINYAGVIREGHGGLTLFLWLFFTFSLGWTIYYFWVHAAEFSIWFAY